MSKHRKLDILSGISQDLLDRATMQRAQLLSGRRRVPLFKQSIFKIAIAAMLCLTIGLPLFWMLFGNGARVPVYQGMTVSTQAPIVENASALTHHPAVLYNSIAQLSHQGLTKTAGKSDFHAADASTYYVSRNVDFYITVHIDNPDNYEILSFTLNGKKYSSYMFENGSDMENLILKCSAEDEYDVKEFTIDAIK